MPFFRQINMSEMKCLSGAGSNFFNEKEVKKLARMCVPKTCAIHLDVTILLS